MKIKCKNCGNVETTSARFFVRLIGGAMPIGGYWAWVVYLFAGTGFAMPIVIAIMTGGVGLLMFQNEIVEWITEKGYECPNCNEKKWEAIK